MEAELWNFKSQNILCAEVDLQVTEYMYSACGISLARLTRVSRDHRPLGQSHLGDAVIYCSILAVGPTGIFVCFLIYYQAVTNQLTYDKDPDIETHRRPLDLSYLQGQHANPKARSQPCKSVLG